MVECRWCKTEWDDEPDHSGAIVLYYCSDKCRMACDDANEALRRNTITYAEFKALAEAARKWKWLGVPI